ENINHRHAYFLLHANHFRKIFRGVGVSRALNDTLFYKKGCKGRDSILAPSLNSSYHQRVFPSDDRFNGDDYALPELRDRGSGGPKILPRLWIESGALCATARGIAAGCRR